MATTKEAEQTAYRDLVAFLRRTQTFITKNKELIMTKKDNAPLTYREVLDTIEERIETHLSELGELEPSQEGKRDEHQRVKLE